jgi:hypothetical protein
VSRPGVAGPFRGVQVGSEVAGEAEPGMADSDQPGPPTGGGRVKDLPGAPAEDLLGQPEGALRVEAAQDACQGRSTPARDTQARKDHSHTGLGLWSPGR